jgi:RND family efflux transporter MFP subunit
MKKVVSFLTHYVLPVLVIVGGIMGARRLIESAPAPERHETVERATLVAVSTVERAPRRVDVRAQGQVRPARAMVLQAQVAGVIESLHPSFEEGGLIREGEEVFRIEQQDYRLAVSMARADRASAEALVELEGGRQVIAERELDLFREEMPSNDLNLSRALREPQRQDAEARVEAAGHRISQARLALERTQVSAPFNAIVREETIEIGQLVGPGVPLAQLVGTDSFWAQVSVPVDELAQIAIPGVNAEVGSRARVWQSGREGQVWEARVLRLLPDLDPVGRMARLLLEVDDPLGLARTDHEEDWLPLFVGAYVFADIEGRRSIDAVELPRAWLREGNRVFVMTPERTLEVREVEVGWRLPDTVLVTNGLRGGEQVVTTNLSVPVAGMRLRVAGEAVGPTPEGSGELAREDEPDE